MSPWAVNQTEPTLLAPTSFLPIPRVLFDVAGFHALDAKRTGILAAPRLLKATAVQRLGMRTSRHEAGNLPKQKERLLI